MVAGVVHRVATAEKANAIAATTNAAAIRTLADNALATFQTLRSIRGDAPSVNRGPARECAADWMSTAADEMTGDSEVGWELPVAAGVATAELEKATAIAATTNAAAIKTLADL